MKKRTKKKLPKKTSKTKSNKNLLTIVNTIAVIIILTILTIGCFYPTKDEESSNNKNNTTQNKQIEKLSKNITFEEKTKALEIEFAQENNDVYLVKPPKPKYTKFTYEEPMDHEMDNIEHIINKIDIPQIDKIEEIKKEKALKEQEEKIKQIDKILTNKPKLIIIIDDVTTKWQINKIKQIGYKVNMAFLPPTKNHKRSASITKDLKNYMIHLPLQASSSRFEEENTLYITTSLLQIDARIKSLKKIYPKARYINNHTGSKFTANKKAMDKLLKTLKKYHFNFIDSRTTAKSVAKLSAKKYGVKMYSRNIFLDNKKDKAYIQKQLRRAMRLAKKLGYAIAIGHPYNITFETLKDSKDMLKDYELLYVEQL
jgi:polysaccharide deacetylase 2 family uncharacterized protein YibQ